MGLARPLPGGCAEGPRGNKYYYSTKSREGRHVLPRGTGTRAKSGERLDEEAETWARCHVHVRSHRETFTPGPRHKVSTAWSIMPSAQMVCGSSAPYCPSSTGKVKDTFSPSICTQEKGWGCMGHQNRGGQQAKDDARAAVGRRRGRQGWLAQHGAEMERRACCCGVAAPAEASHLANRAEP
eukprot:scaffold31448_cov101-Isochrysis_galbana.AAC.4